MSFLTNVVMRLGVYVKKISSDINKKWRLSYNLKSVFESSLSYNCKIDFQFFLRIVKLASSIVNSFPFQALKICFYVFGHDTASAHQLSPRFIFN
jgi:hypothetical protein